MLVWGVLEWIPHERVRAQQTGMPSQLPGDQGRETKVICIHLAFSDVCEANGVGHIRGL